MLVHITGQWIGIDIVDWIENALSRCITVLNFEMGFLLIFRFGSQGDESQESFRRNATNDYGCDNLQCRLQGMPITTSYNHTLICLLRLRTIYNWASELIDPGDQTDDLYVSSDQIGGKNRESPFHLIFNFELEISIWLSIWLSKQEFKCSIFSFSNIWLKGIFFRDWVLN